VSDPVRASVLDMLGETAAELEAFVRGYESIVDPSIDTDDEILNWAFSETTADVCSAIWLLASGFYKGSASSLRSALDISTASLYFQIRENNEPRSGGYNKFFSSWDAGTRDTPNWGEMKPYISSQPSVVRFKRNNGIDVVDEAYEHFRYLCAFAHTRAFASNRDSISAINTTGVAPSFNEEYFQRGRDMTLKTMSLTAILWKIAFPKIASAPGAIGTDAHNTLFPDHLGQLALNHK